MAFSAPGRVALLLCMLACSSGLAAATSSTPCVVKKWYRYMSLHNYPAGVNASDAAAAEAVALKKCSSTFERAVVGSDLGLGEQMFGAAAAPNWHFVKLLDFKSVDAVAAYIKCYEGADVPKASEKAKSIYKVPSCKSSGIKRPITHVYMYNVTTKPNDPAALKHVALSADACITNITCLWKNHVGGPDMGWAQQLPNQVASQYLQVAGNVEFDSTNFLRSYWSYLLGPPETPQLSYLGTLMDGAHRTQVATITVKAA